MIEAIPAAGKPLPTRNTRPAPGHAARSQQGRGLAANSL
jgi:hypothetical protein